MMQGLLFEDERIRDEGDGVFLVASKSSPGSWHRVEAGVCACPGFQHRGRCRHIDMLIEAGKMTQADVRSVTPPAVQGVAFDPLLAGVWTARYQNPVLATGEVLAIQTSNGGPKFPLRYPIVAKMRDLSPDMATMKLPYERFREAYRAKLDRVGIAAIQSQIAAVRARHEGKPVALLCFEQVEHRDRKGFGWCHRTMFSEWYEQQTGIIVPEIHEP